MDSIAAGKRLREDKYCGSARDERSEREELVRVRVRPKTQNVSLITDVS